MAYKSKLVSEEFESSLELKIITTLDVVVITLYISKPLLFQYCTLLFSHNFTLYTSNSHNFTLLQIPYIHCS